MPISGSLFLKVLFLDIDGVVNCKTTGGRNHGRMVIEPRLAAMVLGIAKAVPELKVVLSSSWREDRKSRAIIEKRVVPCFDATPVFNEADDVRGYEIQAWIESNPGVERYAILDDDCDMLPHQLPHFFQTQTDVGITQEIAGKIIVHLTA
jgi:Swiss Army Knife RNA repair-like protein